MPLEWLLAWWNAIYTLPLAFVLVLLAITSIVSLAGGALGELTDGDHDVEHDLDGDLEVDADHDLELDHDLDADLDADGDLDHDGDADSVDRAIAVSRGLVPASGHGPLVTAMVALGVGQAPVFLLLQILVLFWGLIGISLHQLLNAGGPGALAWSIPVTLALSVFLTRGFAAAAGRLFKPNETAALRRDEIVGRTGRVVYAVTADEGTVNVRDQHGTLHRVRARSRNGRLESGREIIVIGYEPDQKLYQVDDATAFVDRP
jgi:membrane protein implicated in regulation of membrane protease activity